MPVRPVTAKIEAIIAASGSGLRLGGDMPKQFQLLAGRPVLAHTLGVFDKACIVNGITVAVPEKYVQHTCYMAAEYGFEKIRAVLPGGESRAESIFAALKSLPGDTDIVLIHDGVRPLVTADLIVAISECAQIYGAAIPGIPLTDTLKEASASGQVIATPVRSKYWRVQTPQGFTYDLIMSAYNQGERDGVLGEVTDDSALVERMGRPVQMIEGSPGNIKITTREDMLMCEFLLAKTAQGAVLRCSEEM